MADQNKLRSTQRTPKVEQDIDRAFREAGPSLCSRYGSLDYEHGQWWVTCRMCGAQWSVVDAEGPGSTRGFDFEWVTDGDEEGHEEES